MKTRDQLAAELKRSNAENAKLKREVALYRAKLVEDSGAGLYQLLIEHKIETAKAWAEKSGVHRVTVSHLIAGKKCRPEFSTLRKLAAPLGIDEAALYQVLKKRGNFKNF